LHWRCTTTTSTAGWSIWHIWPYTTATTNCLDFQLHRRKRCFVLCSQAFIFASLIQQDFASIDFTLVCFNGRVQRIALKNFRSSNNATLKRRFHYLKLRLLLLRPIFEVLQKR